jgi:hypothetical protein
MNILTISGRTGNGKLVTAQRIQKNAERNGKTVFDAGRICKLDRDFQKYHDRAIEMIEASGADIGILRINDPEKALVIEFNQRFGFSLLNAMFGDQELFAATN